MSASEPSYPLHWPMSWPRTKHRGLNPRFGYRAQGVSMSKALDFAEGELQRLGAQAWVISTNIRTRLDGRPYSDQRRPDDPGVAIYFTLKGRRTVLACDRWVKPEDNLWAIAKHIEALRGQARWGVGSVEQAFAGYAALVHRTGPSCWETLGIAPGASEAAILVAWREKAKRAHPDAGGSTDQFQAINEAKDIALATVRHPAAAA